MAGYRWRAAGHSGESAAAEQGPADHGLRGPRRQAQERGRQGQQAGGRPRTGDKHTADTKISRGTLV